jgi:hypothetical protein
MQENAAERRAALQLPKSKQEIYDGAFPVLLDVKQVEEKPSFTIEELVATCNGNLPGHVIIETFNEPEISPWGYLGAAGSQINKNMHGGRVNLRCNSIRITCPHIPEAY